MQQLAPRRGRMSYWWMVMLGKVTRESLNTIWFFNCVTEVELIRPSLHTRGRLCRRQTNIKCIDKRSFYCTKKCQVLRLHNWCSVFSDVDEMVQLRTLMFLFVLGKGLSSEPGFSPVYSLASQIWAALWFMREPGGIWEQTHPWALAGSVKSSWHVSGKEAWQLWLFCALKSM